ncbi:MAG: glycerol-3-phosphate acyltransferase [Candidatus Pacebacteria bacterium]|nr:glycerol-3-phosphate acyltransferase [Candidatus Paceibacterota bacterium]
MFNINYILAPLISYLLGSIPFAFLYAKLVLKKDLRNFGSKNTGALNVLRLASKKGKLFGLISFLIAFILDATKAALAVYLANQFIPGHFVLATTIGSFFAVLGHNYSIILNFKGGRGAASLGGVLLYLDWKVFAGAIAIIICFMVLLEILMGGKLNKKLLKHSISEQIIGRVLGEAYVVWWVSMYNPILFYPVLFSMALVIFAHKDRIIEQIKEINNKTYLND